MKPMFAIIAISARNAVRSKVVLILTSALLASSILVPLTVKGDGTLEGHVQILLRYSLGAGSVLLALATVWAGCAAISLEIQHRRIHLVATKPIPRTHIWLGHWIGLALLNAALLMFNGSINYAILRMRLWREWGSAPTSHTPDVVLTARKLIRPPSPNVEKEVEQELAHMEKEGHLSPNIPRAEYAKALRTSLRQRAWSVPQGGRLLWVLPAFETGLTQAPAIVKFRFSASELSFEKVKAMWRLRRESQTEWTEVVREDTPYQFHTFSVPLSAIAGQGPVYVEFENIDDQPITVLFDPDEGLALLIPATSFLQNYIRALFVIWIHLLFLAALGIGLGTVFSMPVASFVCLCLVFLMFLNNYIQGVAEGELFLSAPQGSWLKHWTRVAVRVTFIALQRVLAPLSGPDPLELLADGILITKEWIARMVAVKVLVYSTAIAVMSNWIFHRRELALPTS